MIPFGAGVCDWSRHVALDRKPGRHKHLQVEAMNQEMFGAKQLNRSKNKNLRNRAKHGFTLVELLVVVSIIALLISILLPSLKKAREQAKSAVCLSNLRALGQGIMLYSAEYDGRLPGPLHPAVYREQTVGQYQGFNNTGATDSTKYLLERQLTYKLRAVMNQKGDGQKVNISDGVSICPSVERVLSPEHFERYAANTGRNVFPFHYAINNYGNDSADPASGFSDNVQKTNPPNYFGGSPAPGSTAEPTPPVTLARIKRASDEWAVADAWYRTRNLAIFPFLQQEGTFQSNWSGSSLTFTPPHRRSTNLTVFVNGDNERRTAAQTFATKKKDGYTQSVFFDGHAAAVKSRSLVAQGQTFNYGFPGTVNIDFRGYPDSVRNNYRSLEWR